MTISLPFDSIILFYKVGKIPTFFYFSKSSASTCSIKKSNFGESSQKFFLWYCPLRCNYLKIHIKGGYNVRGSGSPPSRGSPFAHRCSMRSFKNICLALFLQIEMTIYSLNQRFSIIFFDLKFRFSKKIV